MAFDYILDSNMNGGSNFNDKEYNRIKNTCEKLLSLYKSAKTYDEQCVFKDNIVNELYVYINFPNEYDKRYNELVEYFSSELQKHVIDNDEELD